MTTRDIHHILQISALLLCLWLTHIYPTGRGIAIQKYFIPRIKKPEAKVVASGLVLIKQSF